MISNHEVLVNVVFDTKNKILEIYNTVTNNFIDNFLLKGNFIDEDSSLVIKMTMMKSIEFKNSTLSINNKFKEINNTDNRFPKIICFGLGRMNERSNITYHYKVKE